MTSTLDGDTGALQAPLLAAQDSSAGGARKFNSWASFGGFGGLRLGGGKAATNGSLPPSDSPAEASSPQPGSSSAAALPAPPAGSALRGGTGNSTSAALRDDAQVCAVAFRLTALEYFLCRDLETDGRLNPELYANTAVQTCPLPPNNASHGGVCAGACRGGGEGKSTGVHLSLIHI